MSGIRFAFYILIYVLAVISGVDTLALLITAPLFAAILLCLPLAQRDRIDYVDAVSLVYFISFVIVPLQKISDRTFGSLAFAGGHVVYPQSYFITVAALALASYLALIACLRHARRSSDTPNRPVNVSASLLVAIAIVLAIAAVLASGSIENLQAGRRLREESESLFLVPLIIAILSVNAVFSILRSDTSRRIKVFAAIVCCLCLAWVANPLNTSRFLLLGAWIPVLLCVVPQLMKPTRFYAAVPLVLLVALPLLTITTRSGGVSFEDISNFSDTETVFSIGYFDLFESGCEAMRYVDRFGHEDGNLLLFTITSFVPRSIWPDKPINSGLLLGYMNVSEGMHTENLAAPWFMDGYMDFGIAGSLIYGMLLGLALRFCARRRMIVLANVDVIFIFLTANLAILLRGTLGVVMFLFVFQFLFLLLYARMFSQGEPRWGAERGVRARPLPLAPQRSGSP